MWIPGGILASEEEEAIAVSLRLLNDRAIPPPHESGLIGTGLPKGAWNGRL